jgi:hypothetical protein
MHISSPDPQIEEEQTLEGIFAPRSGRSRPDEQAPIPDAHATSRRIEL